MQPFDLVTRANSDYIEQLYQRYQTDPRSVDERWRAFFAGFDAGGGRPTVSATPPPEGAGAEPILLSLGVQDLVHSYRELGHFVARLDPLGHNRPNHPLLDLSQFNISLSDLDRQAARNLLRHHRR